jgi:hypothetical protein
MQAVGAVAASLVTQLRSPAATQVSIPILREDRLPALFVLAVDRSIPDRVVMFWENGGVGLGTPVLRRRLTDAEKSALEQRASELRDALAPWPESSRDKLLEEISGMLGAFPSMQRLDEETAMCMAAAYLWTVRGRPHWAISKGCGMVRAGAAGFNPSYCPSEPEFNKMIGRLIADYVNRLAATERLLAAKAEQRPVRPVSLQPIPTASPGSDRNHAARAIADLQARKVQRMPQVDAPDRRPATCRTCTCRLWNRLMPVLLNPDDEAAARHRAQERQERFAGRLPALAAAGGPTMAQRLCARFGIRGIPHGWDAIDVTQKAHEHGSDFPRIVDEMLVAEATRKGAG